MSGPTAGLGQKPQFPLGQYNKPNARSDPFGPLEGAKRSRFMFPSGSFNASGSSPYSTLDGAGRSNNKMNNDINKNLLHTQNNYTQRMNITRIILPVSLLQSTHIRSPPFVLYKPFVSGDVMFSLRYHRHLYQTRQASPAVSNLLPAYSCHVNLQTLNYILLNVQNTILLKFQHEMFVCDNQVQEAQQLLAQNNNISGIDELPWMKWLTQIFLGISTQTDFTMILSDLLPQDQNDVQKIRQMSSTKINEMFKAKVLKIMMTLFRISGIFIGSEYQGGQHQGDLNPCSHNPVDHSAAMQIAGKFEKVRNMWATCDKGVSSGDVLGFRLKTIAKNQLGFELSGNPQTSKIVSVDRMQVEALLDAKRLNWNLLVPSVMGSELPTIDDRDSSVFGTACCYTIGLVNQMSKAVLSTEQLEIIAINAMSCAQHTNTEVLLQFSMPNFEKVSRMTMHDIPRRIAALNIAPDAPKGQGGPSFGSGPLGGDGFGRGPLRGDGFGRGPLRGDGFGSGAVGSGPLGGDGLGSGAVGTGSLGGDGLVSGAVVTGGFGGGADGLRGGSSRRSGSVGAARRGAGNVDASTGSERRSGGVSNPAAAGGASVDDGNAASSVPNEGSVGVSAPAAVTNTPGARQAPRRERVHDKFFILEPVTEHPIDNVDQVYNMDAEEIAAVQKAYTIADSMKKIPSNSTTLFSILEEQQKNNKKYVKAGEQTYMLISRSSSQ